MWDKFYQNISREKILELYAFLLKIRKTEFKIEEHYHEDEMKTPVHLSLGQEAVAVGVCANLRKEDNIFSNHRSHAHYLAKGGDLKAMMAELYCKEAGCSKGRGGSMHLIDTSVGHLGCSAIVAGSIPHAVGAGFAYKMQKKDLVAVVFFGDAACEQGILYESMNLAKMMNLPVIFVCENNKYAVCSHISARQVDDNLYKRASAFNLPAKRIDGMDVLEVYSQSREVIERARRGKGPFFLECTVQRWRAHSGAGDPLREQYRKPEDMDESNKRDPVESLVNYILKHDIAVSSELDEIAAAIEREIEEAFEYAKQSPLPQDDELERYLYS